MGKFMGVERRFIYDCMATLVFVVFLAVMFMMVKGWI